VNPINIFVAGNRDWYRGMHPSWVGLWAVFCIFSLFFGSFKRQNVKHLPGYPSFWVLGHCMRPMSRPSASPSAQAGQKIDYDHTHFGGWSSVIGPLEIYII
jgi:hypothetical protein